MNWQMFHMPAGESTRHDKSCIRLHYMEDFASSVGFVEQTFSRPEDYRALRGTALFRVHMNNDAAGITQLEGIEVPDLEAGMALIKILANHVEPNTSI